MDSAISGQTLRLISSLAVRAPFDAAIVPNFEVETGCKVEVDWLPTAMIMEKLAAGERAEVLIVVAASIDKLAEQGLVEPASRIDLVDSSVGLAVRAGAPHPDISTLDAFKRALVEARSVAYSRAGASGIHFETVLERLGIADAVRSKATVIPAGFTAEKLVSGEADLAVQQVSELMVVPGIEVIGRFPEPVEAVTTFSAAIMRDAANRPPAERFLATLRNERAAAAYRAAGLDPASE
ncbi:MAG TPA: substrate-binding domain-containing protein [Acetobacteraceae bacterium]|jgi:molybdate transport system substrate-binding protein|nr:substrate-binding domain-containing protein [Acetobacteraceae bacterium]